LCGENNICFSFYFQTLLELYTENNALELAPSLPSPPLFYLLVMKKTRLKEDFGTLFFFKKSNLKKSITASLQALGP